MIYIRKIRNERNKNFNIEPMFNGPNAKPNNSIYESRHIKDRHLLQCRKDLISGLYVTTLLTPIG